MKDRTFTPSLQIPCNFKESKNSKEHLNEFQFFYSFGRKSFQEIDLVESNTGRRNGMCASHT